MRAARLHRGFGRAAAGWSSGQREDAQLSVGRCWVCLGLRIIYPVLSPAHISTVFALNSSILAGAGLTSSTSAQESPAGWSCLRQHSSTRCFHPLAPNPAVGKASSSTLPKDMDDPYPVLSRHPSIPIVQWEAMPSPSLESCRCTKHLRCLCCQQLSQTPHLKYAAHRLSAFSTSLEWRLFALPLLRAMQTSGIVAGARMRLAGWSEVHRGLGPLQAQREKTGLCLLYLHTSFPFTCKLLVLAHS